MASTSLSENYDQNASAYSQFLNTPLGTLESQLFTHTFFHHHHHDALPDLRDQHILDLGGGTGLRARDALAAGASAVDVVDISPSMMQIGQAHESSMGRDRIRWFQADVSKPLDHLGLRVYDGVIANGIFDHAGSEEELVGMWRNAAAYLREGGWVVANRNNPRSKVADVSGLAPAAAAAATTAGTEAAPTMTTTTTKAGTPTAAAAASASVPAEEEEEQSDAETATEKFDPIAGKYGVAFSDFRPFPGGYTYRYRMLLTGASPLEFESKALDVYASGSLQVPGRFFDDFRTVPWQETPVVKADPQFWREYLEDPILFIFTARKKKIIMDEEKKEEDGTA